MKHNKSLDYTIKKKKSKKLKKKNLIILFFMIIFLILFTISLVKIINYTKDTRSSKKIEKIVNDSITINEKKDNPRSREDEKYVVDFEKLKSENKDTVAYLKVEGTNIDYVIVKGKDNDYYLHHSFDKSYNVLGWPFADYRNKFDGTDKNIIIYGHDVKTGYLRRALAKSYGKS